MNKQHLWKAMALLAIATPVPGAWGAEVQFHFYDIGNFGCLDGTIAYDVNDLGMVGGVSGTFPCPSEDGHSFVWINGKMTDLWEDSLGPELHSATFLGRDGMTFAGSGAGSEYIVFLHDGVAKAMPTPPECFQNGFAEGMNRGGTMIGGSCTLIPDNWPRRPAIYFH